jgi:hypothetical protein
MSDQVVPGPYPDGCPPPTAVDCIQVTKVYDFCFSTETRDNLCFPIPASCGTLPSGTTCTVSVTSVSCTTVSSTPVANGFANVTLLVTVDLSISLFAPSGATICTFTGTFSFFKTIVLCAPDGTTITCQAPSNAVGTCVIIGNDVCSIVTICLLIQSVATVNLLVPTFGFCTPAPCVVAPSPPFACPPSPLYPPQCVFPGPTPTPTPEPPVPEPPVGGPLG